MDQIPLFLNEIYQVLFYVREKLRVEMLIRSDLCVIIFGFYVYIWLSILFGKEKNTFVIFLKKLSSQKKRN